jgi:hypothetical protein
MRRKRDVAVGANRDCRARHESRERTPRPDHVGRGLPYRDDVKRGCTEILIERRFPSHARERTASARGLNTSSENGSKIVPKI